MSDQAFKIKLKPLESLLCFKRTLSFLPQDVVNISISPTPPPSRWNELRLPGSYLPYVIKCGSYLTSDGWQFWQVFAFKKDQPVVIIELKNNRYKKLVLQMRIEQANALLNLLKPKA